MKSVRTPLLGPLGPIGRGGTREGGFETRSRESPLSAVRRGGQGVRFVISAVPTATRSHFASTRILLGPISSYGKSTSALRGCGESHGGKTETLQAQTHALFGQT